MFFSYVMPTFSRRVFAAMLLASAVCVSDAMRVGCAGGRCSADLAEVAISQTTNSSSSAESGREYSSSFPLFTDLGGVPYTVAYDSRCAVLSLRQTPHSAAACSKSRRSADGGSLLHD